MGARRRLHDRARTRPRRARRRVPVSGGTARYPHYSHGSVVGYTVGWLWWLGAVTLAPIEVEATLQYFTHYWSWLTTTSGGETVLTTQGYGVAIVLMAIFTFVNAMGVRWLAKANMPITAWKLAIPVLAIVALKLTRFHAANFTAAGGFMPFGFHGVFSALATGGVIFAYQGFEQAVQVGGESANPRRNIPIAVIGAMLMGVVIYILLQVAFLGALDPSNLQHGWSKLAFNGLVGPFAGLATAVGLGWLAVLLYIDAAVSRAALGFSTPARAHESRTRSVMKAGGRASSTGSRGPASRFSPRCSASWSASSFSRPSRAGRSSSGSSPRHRSSRTRLRPWRSSRSAGRIRTASGRSELRAALFVAPFGFVVANLIVVLVGLGDGLADSWSRSRSASSRSSPIARSAIATACRSSTFGPHSGSFRTSAAFRSSRTSAATTDAT